MITIFVTLLAIEGVARLAGLTPKPNPFMQDTTLGWRWLPGFDGYAQAGLDRVYTLRISSQGLRDDNVYPIPKPEGVTRVLMLGDSVVAGQGVDFEDTFVHRLDVMAGPDVEVINGGVADYNTQQELLWLDKFGLRFEPDVVVLVYAMNDGRAFEPKPLYTAPVTGVYNLLLRHSAAYGWYVVRDAERRETALEGGSAARFRYMDTYRTRDWVDDPNALGQLFGEARDDWSMAWDSDALDANLVYLDEVLRLAQQNDIKLVLLIAPTHAQVAAQQFPPGIRLNSPQERLGEWARIHDVRVISPLEAMRAYGSDELFIDQVHLSPLGHDMLADMLAESGWELGVDE